MNAIDKVDSLAPGEQSLKEYVAAVERVVSFTELTGTKLVIVLFRIFKNFYQAKYPGVTADWDQLFYDMAEIETDEKVNEFMKGKLT